MYLRTDGRTDGQRHAHHYIPRTIQSGDNERKIVLLLIGTCMVVGTRNTKTEIERLYLRGELRWICTKVLKMI